MKSLLHSFCGAILLFMVPDVVNGQTKVLEDCLQAFKVQLPLYSEAYASLPTDPLQNLPILYYLPEDQFTFWYQIESAASDTLTYKVWPTNEYDQFRAVLYRYGDMDFCRDLAIGNVSQEEVLRETFVVDTESFTTEGYQYDAYIESGQSYFLSILSLNEDYCGHRLTLEFRGSQMEFHAMSKPCYNFEALDLNLSDTDLAAEEDTALDLMLEDRALDEQEGPKSTVLEPVIQPAPRKVENAIQRTPETEKNIVAVENEIDSSEIGRSLKSGEKLDLQGVYFYNNTYAFREDSEPQLNKLYQWLQANPDVEIEIGGHTSGDTDNIRPNPNFKDRGKAWNFKGSSKQLSKKRAEAVKEYLVEKSISPHRLKTTGYGDSEKIIENPKTPSDHRRNMRVEVSIISD